MGGNVSTASSTPAGGWYADPLDASLLRWWDGSTWSKQTMPSDAAPSTPDPRTLSAVAPVLTAVPRGDEPYVPSNSVFRMAETVAGEAYVPEWSGLAEISDEVARSGVPVQLALTSTPSEPPIPVSADVFPSLRPESAVTPAVKEPAWHVEAPLAAPVDKLFPVTSAAAAFPVASPAAAFPTTPVAPVAPAAPVMPPVVAPVLAPVVMPVLAPESTLSAQVFPAAAPTPVPQPAGDSFPGLVPSSAAAPPAPVAPAPTLFADPPPPAPVALAPAPVALAPAPEAPVALAPAPAVPAPAPEPVLYAGPAPTEVAPDPVAPPDFQPFAASTPGASYVPVAPRPIPQPLQLGAPTPSATPAEIVPIAPSAPTEYWPTQGTPSGGQYQPNPGDYVPYDPNAVHLEPVPVIPFSSRDPYNSASTARPGMRAYAAAPVGPTGSTWTGGLAFILLAPLMQAAAYFAWIQLVATGTISNGTFPYIAGTVAIIGVLALASSQFDRNALAKRGYFDLASPFWVLLVPPLVYLIVRATRLSGQGRGAPVAIVLSLLSSAAAGGLIAFALMPLLATLHLI